MLMHGTDIAVQDAKAARGIAILVAALRCEGDIWRDIDGAVPNRITLWVPNPQLCGIAIYVNDELLPSAGRKTPDAHEPVFDGVQIVLQGLARRFSEYSWGGFWQVCNRERKIVLYRKGGTRHRGGQNFWPVRHAKLVFNLERRMKRRSQAWSQVIK